jgi:glycosyltransferase involved in cell wall biosynthesis
MIDTRTTSGEASLSGAAMVDIITRTRNRPHFLKRACEAVLGQSYGNWRHHVINDGGDRESVDAVINALAFRYAGRGRLHHLDAQVGMEAASNTAIRQGSAPWIIMLDDDDTWTSDCLSQLTSFATTDSVRSGVACRSEIIHEECREENFIEVSRESFNPALVALSLVELAQANRITNNAFLFRRTAFEALGGFSEDLRVYGDWDFALRFLLRYDIEVLPEALAHYHQRRSSAGAVGNSFSEPRAAEQGRAVLLNRWIRQARTPPELLVAGLLALGGHILTSTALAGRLHKHMNALHKLRQKLFRFL